MSFGQIPLLSEIMFEIVELPLPCALLIHWH